MHGHSLPPSHHTEPNPDVADDPVPAHRPHPPSQFTPNHHPRELPSSLLQAPSLTPAHCTAIAGIDRASTTNSQARTESIPPAISSNTLQTYPNQDQPPNLDTNLPQTTMAALPQATPLLLTKRLNAFLRAHTSASLPTLLLTTHHGKLLAHASSLHQPVAVLRMHATVAASLLAIHTTSSSSTVPPPTGTSPSSSSTSSVIDDDDDDDETAHGSDDDNDQPPHRAAAAAAAPVRPVTITVQLSGGTVIIRRLKCGLLLVCVGPSSSQDAAASSSSPTPAAAATPTSTNASVAAVTQALESADLLSATTATTATATAGETESLTSPGEQTATITTASSEGVAAAGAAAAATSVVALRRRAAELARWLDEKLGALTVPEDSTGAD